MAKIETVVKNALLNGKDFQTRRGWIIKISNDDKVQIWPPKGEGRETTLAFLDKAVSDFCRQADVMAPGVNQTNPPKSTSDGSLGKDTSTKSPKKFEPSVNKTPKPDGSFTPKDLGTDTTGNEGFATPSINKDMTPDNESLTDTDLGKDTSGNSTKFDNKVVNVQSDGRTGKKLRSDRIDDKIPGDSPKRPYVVVDEKPEMGTGIFINSEEDMEWLISEHLSEYPNIVNKFHAAEIIGNEDSPDYICLYEDGEPTINDEFVCFGRPDEYGPEYRGASKIQDTFANGPDPSEIYRKLNAKSVSKSLLAGILNEEEWEAQQRLAQMDKMSPKRGPHMPGKGEATFSEGNAGGQIGGDVDEKEVSETPKRTPDKRSPEEQKTVKHNDDVPEFGDYWLPDHRRMTDFERSGKKVAGPKLREKWLNDGGYHREIESESAEELHALVQGFGGEDVDWSRFKPTQPDEKDAEEIQQPPANGGQQVAAKKVAQDDDDITENEQYNRNFRPYEKPNRDEDPEYEEEDLDGEMTPEDYAETYINGNISDCREAINSGLVDFSEVMEAVEMMAGPQEVKTFARLMNKRGQSADVEAIDDSAKETINNYMGEYGKELTKDDGVAPKGKNPKKMLDKGKGKKAQSSDFDLHGVVYAMEGDTKFRVKPIWRDEALATLENEETGERTRVPIGDLREFYTLLDSNENVVSSPDDYESGDEDAKYAKKADLLEDSENPRNKKSPGRNDWDEDEGTQKVLKQMEDEENKRWTNSNKGKGKLGQAAPAPATPDAAPAAPGASPTAPSPGGQAPAPGGQAPVPKAPGGPKSQPLQPGVGDAGIQALGWTAQDVQEMTDEQKQGILKLKLTKPGTQPKQQMPAPKTPAPKTPAPGGPAAPAGPAAPGAEPAPPAPSAPAPKATKGGKKVKRGQAAPLPQTEEAPAAPAQDAPQSPAAPPKAPATPAAPKGPAKPAGQPAPDPGQDSGGMEQKAFQILQETQSAQVQAATPNEIVTAKVSQLLQRLITELGLTPEDAGKLFGIQRNNFSTLFK